MPAVMHLVEMSGCVFERFSKCFCIHVLIQVPTPSAHKLTDTYIHHAFAKKLVEL